MQREMADLEPVASRWRPDQVAPEVTRERLYIETLEGVMTKVGKVMVDVEGSGNLMYLPLEKMMQGSGGSGGSGRSVFGSSMPQIPTGSNSSGNTSQRNPSQQRSREVR